MKDRLVTIAMSVAATFGLIKAAPESPRELDVDRLIVRKELIVSDSGEPWEKGYEEQQIARGIYARSVGNGSTGGLWVRSRLIKGEIDDPFDDRFHALESDGTLRCAGAYFVERVARRLVAANGDHPGRGARIRRNSARPVERQHASRPLALSIFSARPP